MDLSNAFGLPNLPDELERVETALRQAIVGDDPFLSEVAGHLLLAGGGRLRPALAIATAVTGGAEVTGDVIDGGAAVELVHQGSLYHDDVMDEAVLRRGVETVNAKWGNLVAIVAGDFLLARASQIAAGLGTEVTALLASTIGRLCEGQVGELQHAFSTDRPEEAYFSSIGGKTASLFACACRIGALTAHLEPAAVAGFTAYGEALGMLYQVRDDILDVIATDEELGKPAGLDLVEGVYTLPVLRALADADAGPELLGLLGRRLDEPERDKAREIVRASSGVAQAVAVARGFADDAAAAIEPWASGPTGAALAGLGHRLVDDVVR